MPLDESAKVTYEAYRCTFMFMNCGHSLCPYHYSLHTTYLKTISTLSSIQVKTQPKPERAVALAAQSTWSPGRWSPASEGSLPTAVMRQVEGPAVAQVLFYYFYDSYKIIYMISIIYRRFSVIQSFIINNIALMKLLLILNLVNGNMIKIYF